jgi:hypothetical protein
MVIQKEVEGTSFDSAFQTGNASLMTLDQYTGSLICAGLSKPEKRMKRMLTRKNYPSMSPAA